MQCSDLNIINAQDVCKVGMFIISLLEFKTCIPKMKGVIQFYLFICVVAELKEASSYSTISPNTIKTQ